MILTGSDWFERARPQTPAARQIANSDLEIDPSYLHWRC